MPQKIDPVEQEIKEIMEQLTPEEQERFIQDLEAMDDDDDQPILIGYDPEIAIDREPDFRF